MDSFDMIKFNGYNHFDFVADSIHNWIDSHSNN